jgi:plastocyanin
MHPSSVAVAAWVLAATSKVPFYVVGAALAASAVALSAFGATHPAFPRSPGQRTLVITVSLALVAGTMTAAVLTAGGEGHKAQARPAAGAPASSRLALAADPTGLLSYTPRAATVRAGTDTITFINRSTLPHNVTVAQGSKVVAATRTITGSTTSSTARLRPGRYVFFCSVDAHRQAGMQGTLTVK